MNIMRKVEEDHRRIDHANMLLKDCVHYGFCVSVCPTYVVTRDENESPRGRIDLINEMLNSDAPPKPETVNHLDSCLSCLSCMSTCAAQVDYQHLIDAARGHIEDHYTRPPQERLARTLVAATVPHPGRFRLALRAAKLAKPLAGLLPASLRGMVELAPAAPLPEAPPAGLRSIPAEGERVARVALLPGCAQQVLAPHITEAAIRLLARHGCEVYVPAVECCGALTLHMGKEKAGRRTASAAIEQFAALHARAPLDAIVVTASGCGTTMKDYGHVFAEEGPDGDAAAVAGRVFDLTEMVARLTLRDPVRRTGLKVAYHDACSLQHAQKIRKEPRALLKAAGFTVADVPEGHFCCGSAGTYNMLQPEMADTLGRRKAANIESTGADVACMGNLGCLEQLDRYAGLPLVHTVELLDWATGGPLPPAMAGLDIPEAPRAPEPAAEVVTVASTAHDDEDDLW